jgi:hypothetical protein
MKRVFIFCSILFSIPAFGQDTITEDYLVKIKNYDLSGLWTLEKFETDNDTTTVRRAEPLGFIGENFQRFHIRFISVTKSSANRYEYLVRGETKVKENVCQFHGTLRVTSAKTYIESDISNVTQGFVQGDYAFSENPDQKGSGVLKGRFQTHFYIDQHGKLKYDALNFEADGFSNNQFEGSWTSYKTKVSKKCNWGDYRIPDSKELDIGTGEFMPVAKYKANGWMDYGIRP